MSRTRRRDLSRRELEEIAEEILTEVANDFPEDLDTLQHWLVEAARNPDAIKSLQKFNHMPVSPREFVESPNFMNKPQAMWPAVMDCFEELNSGKYVESVLTGGIGVGKTHLALYTQAYQLYMLSCLRDPHAEFDLDPSSEIIIVFQSITKDLAKGVDYQRFRSMIEGSPYFQKHFPFDADITSEMRFPKRIIVKPISGQDTGAIGQNVIGGLIDEINFMAVIENSKHSKDGEIYDQAVKNYNSIARRRESRFMKLGSLPGMLCLVSSRNYPGQFTDKKEKEARTNPRIYVYDKRVWEVRPWLFSFHEGKLSKEVVELYGPKAPFWFDVFIGDESRKPRLIGPGETVSASERPLVMSIPIEYRKEFENDLLPSLRDIAGVATQALHPFMLNTDAVAECFGKSLSILSREDCDFVDSKVLMYPKRIVHPDAPRFIHIDLALTRDSAGVSCGHVPGFKDMDRGGYTETLPIIQYDFILEVRPPRGGEIEYENIRQLIYKLRDKLMLPVKWVSFDQFQSTDSQQILYREGFITGQQSMDTNTAAYDLLKQAFYDRRIIAPAHPKAQKEIVTLEFNPKKNKIDHPPNGSKDVSDSMAGVAIGLTRMRENWSNHDIPTYKIPSSVLELASTKNSVDRKQERPKSRLPHEERLYG